MPYNQKQYDAAERFFPAADTNITSAWDQKRVQSYDLYENIYRNAVKTLQIVLRGDDQSPILMPNGKKIVEATHRFLGKNVGYVVEAQGDAGAQQAVDDYWKDMWSREAVPTKFGSNLRWGLVRGDFYFYIYANPNKAPGKRISIDELDPRQVFEIEDSPTDPNDLTGVHIVDLVQDFREPDKPDKMIARRRTFRQQQDPSGAPLSVTSELTHWEVGKWDDRTIASRAKLEQVPYPEADEEEQALPGPIIHLPVYKVSNDKTQNSSWGTSLLAGLETLLYAINQSLSDEDATIVFQGLGMYVTNASPPLDENGDVTDWNIGPKQIIELSGEETFTRVTGLSGVEPYAQHMGFMNDGMAEASGTPQTAIGRVDVAVAQSGIALQLELMPLIAANADREVVLINLLDQMFNDITREWLPAYEKGFDNLDVMSEISVVCVFDDPMPHDHTADVLETVQLAQANLILNSMAVAKLRSLGWKYPTVDEEGNQLSDDDIAAMLLQQTQLAAQAIDPFSQSAGQDDGTGDGTGDGQDQPDNTPSKTTIKLGTS